MESSQEIVLPRPGATAQPSAAVRKRHRNPRGQGARLTEDIVSGALALIERTGSAEAVTLRAVAREVGIAAPSIYAHFPTGTRSLAAVVVRIFDELTEAIEQGLKSADQEFEPATSSRAARRTWPSGWSTLPVTACCSPRSRRPRRTVTSRSRSALTAGRRSRSGGDVRAPRPSHRGLRRRGVLHEHRRRGRCHRRVGRHARDRQPANRATAIPVARPSRIRPSARAVPGQGDSLRIRRPPSSTRSATRRLSWANRYITGWAADPKSG